MKFNLDEKVRLKSMGNLGTIRKFKIEGGYNKEGQYHEDIKYLVELTKGTKEWFQERSLKPEFDEEFNLGFNQLLIDVNLKSGNFHYVEALNEERDRLNG